MDLENIMFKFLVKVLESKCDLGQISCLVTGLIVRIQYFGVCL